MQPQELADRAEDAAIARLLAMRAIFMPCWGSMLKPRAVSAGQRRRPAAAD